MLVSFSVPGHPFVIELCENLIANLLRHFKLHQIIPAKVRNRLPNIIQPGQVNQHGNVLLEEGVFGVVVPGENRQGAFCLEHVGGG